MTHTMLLLSIQTIRYQDVGHTVIIYSSGQIELGSKMPGMADWKSERATVFSTE